MKPLSKINTPFYFKPTTYTTDLKSNSDSVSSLTINFDSRPKNGNFEAFYNNSDKLIEELGKCDIEKAQPEEISLFLNHLKSGHEMGMIVHEQVQEINNKIDLTQSTLVKPKNTALEDKLLNCLFKTLDEHTTNQFESHETAKSKRDLTFMIVMPCFSIIMGLAAGAGLATSLAKAKTQTPIQNNDYLALDQLERQ